MSDQVTTQGFPQQVLQATQPVIVDFFAPWCNPCKLVGPMLEEIGKERTDLKIVTVDVDQEPELARQHRVMSVPTLVMYHRGQIMGQWVGLRPKQLLLKEINAALAKA